MNPSIAGICHASFICCSIKEQVKFEPEIIHNLDPQQQKALELMNQGENVFLNGGTASGRSSVLNAFRHQNPARRMLFLAPDGISAIKVNGTNLYDFFSNANFMEFVDPQTMPNRFCDYAKSLNEETIGFNKNEILRHIDCIVFDNISRVSAYFFDAINAYFYESNEFGREMNSIQVVVAGNFYEDSPSQANVPVTSFHGLDYLDSYAFCSTTWHNINFHTIELTNNYLQTNDGYFRDILDNLITLGGDVSKAIEALNNHELKCRNENRPKDSFALDIFTQYPCLNLIDNANQIPYQWDGHTYEASSWGTANFYTCLIAKYLQLKLGDKVIFIADNPPYYAAGMVAYVTKLDSNEIHVQLKNGTIINVGKHSWQYPNGAISQYPLLPCKAISARDIQGMFLDSVNIISGNEPFSVETLYSILSRVRSLNGVRLDKLIDIAKVSTDSNSRAFYENKIDWNRVFSCT